MPSTADMTLLAKERKAMALVEARCVSDRWFPREPDQQTLIAALDRCPDWIRRIVVETFFGLRGTCPSCRAVRRIHRISRVADFLNECDSGRCSRSSTGDESIELKPHGAPRHWSPALRKHFLEARDIGLIRPIAGMRLSIPEPGCGPGQCAECPHPRHHRNRGPALPQVVMAYLTYGTHVRVLSPSAADATTLYDTLYFDFTIDPERVSTRPIPHGLSAMVKALRPWWDAGAIDQADRIRLQHMIGALWARLPWVPWEELVRLAGPMLPPWARLAAPAYVGLL